MSNAEKTVMFALPNMMTGQLACVAGTAAGRSWDLSAGTFTIGRQEEHDMSLPQEPGISKLHAKIIGQGDRYLITDCESRNGTLLNGELIQRADLYDGDEIRICGCVLRFTQKGGPARPRPRVAAEPVVAAANVVAAPVAVAPLMMAPAPPPSSTGRSLAAWYAAGLLGTLLLGGAASAALVANAPAPVPPVVAAVAPVVPAPVAVVDAGVAVAVDAGVPAAVETVAAAEAAAAVPDIDAAAVAEDKPADEKPVELALDEPKATKTTKPSSSKPAASSSSSGGTFSAAVEGGRSETLRSKTGGRVRTVEVKDGAQVVKGTILVTFETGADGDEIATLEDRIASLEAVEGEEAKRDLRQARARLAALEGGQKATPIAAGMDGQLTGFSVSPGTVIKAGEVVGKLVDGEVSTRVRVTVARGTSAKAGQKVSLTLTGGGSGEGTVVAVNGRVVIVDTGSVSGDTVDSVTFE